MGIPKKIAPTQEAQSAVLGSTAPPRHSEIDALAAALADMTASFSDDFLNGLMGKRHNSYEHRSRVLRQMTGTLVLMRAQDAALAP